MTMYSSSFTERNSLVVPENLKTVKKKKKINYKKFRTVYSLSLKTKPLNWPNDGVNLFIITIQINRHYQTGNADIVAHSTAFGSIPHWLWVSKCQFELMLYKPNRIARNVMHDGMAYILF